MGQKQSNDYFSVSTVLIGCLSDYACFTLVTTIKKIKQNKTKTTVSCIYGNVTWHLYLKLFVQNSGSLDL